MASLEANPHYIIYFDNVRVDEFVKSWTVNLSCGGNIGTAEIEFVYLADLAYTAASVKDIKDSKSIMRMLGVIDNMTNVKIFIKNVFSQKYQLVFDGNIKGKSSSRSPRGSSLVFRATDYMAWTNRTIAPIVIPYTQSTHPSDKFVWEAQGIDVNKVMDVSQKDIIGFKGKRLEEIVNTVITQSLAANKIYSSKQGVAYWDGIWDRMDLMADIDPDILNKNVLDYIISPNQGSVDTMYVLLNDIFAKLMFEFYQDRDGIIRIKPPFWNEPVLKSHIIDPTLILNQSETSDYDKYISRVVITGGLDENFQTAGDFASKLWTPTGAYLSDGTWETVQKCDKWINGWENQGGSGSDGSGVGTGDSITAPGGLNSKQMTKNGYRYIKGGEGFAPWGCYFNKEKHKTVGYGTISTGPNYAKHQPFPCSEKKASEIYAERIEKEFGAYLCKKMDAAGISGKIKDHQYDAMLSASYNVGSGGFVTYSSSPWHIIKKDPNNLTAIRAAWEKFALTNGSTGQVEPGLVRRRKEEANMYCNGSYTFGKILKYNQNGKVDGYMTDNNGHGYIPDSLKGTFGAKSLNDNSMPDNSTVFVEFDTANKRKGNIYKRRDGSPIVGSGDSEQYSDLKGNGVWWPDITTGITGHIQHLASHFRGHLLTVNRCVDPKFGENSDTSVNLLGLNGIMYKDNAKIKNTISHINKMLKSNNSDYKIGAESMDEYNARVTPEMKKKIRKYFIKLTQGRGFNLSSSMTREQFIETYFNECKEELVFPDVAIAHMLTETGALSFKESVLYQQNNFGGIGATTLNYTYASDWYWQHSIPRSVIHSTNEDAVVTVEYKTPENSDELIDSKSSMSGRSLSRAAKPKYVIIDAGHGGDDEGVVGGKSEDKYYLKEKDVALWLQNRIVDILKYNKINAYHSRTNDRNIGSGSTYAQRTTKILNDIKNRGHKPEEYVVISIHAGGGNTSSRGYSLMTHSSESGTNSNNLLSSVKTDIGQHVWHYWSASGASKPEKANKKSALSSLSEKNFPGGTILIESIFVSNLEDRKLWLGNGDYNFRDAYAVGVSSGIASFLGKTLNGKPSLEIEDTNEDRVDPDSTATPDTHPNSGLWNGSTFKEDLDWSDVDFGELLKPTHDEMRYGGSVAQIEQPLIKFSNSGAYYDMQGEHNADANEVLKSYAKFYMNMNNSLINTSSVTMIGAPWIRPGFNVWIDPAYTDKVYYVNGITHSGAAGAGATTTLQLVHGRHRDEFVKDGDSRGFGALSKNDDSIFTKNEYFKSAKHFGPVLSTSADYNKEQSNLITIMTNCNQQGVIKAERSPYAAYYASDYGDAFLKSPVILKKNDAGKEIFTDEEWKEITGMTTVIDTAIDKGDGESSSDKKDEDKKSRSNTADNSNNPPKQKSSLPTNMNPTSRTGTRSFVNNGVLKKGKRGAKIKELQGIMNEFMDKSIITGKDKLALDGSFGPLTDGVVRAYQKAKSIAIDGMVGPITTANINSDLNSSGGSGNNDTSTDMDTGVNNTNPTNKNPVDELEKAKGRLSRVLFTDQYTPSQIQSSLDNVYKSFAPGVVKQRMYIIEQGMISARKTSEKTYLNNNYNK